jgi:hypothetical protein
MKIIVVYDGDAWHPSVPTTFSPWLEQAKLLSICMNCRRKNSPSILLQFFLSLWKNFHRKPFNILMILVGKKLCIRDASSR